MGKPDDAYDDEMVVRGAYEDRGEYSGQAPPHDSRMREFVVHRETSSALLVSGTLMNFSPSGEFESGVVLSEKWLPKSKVYGWIGGSEAHNRIYVPRWLALKITREHIAKCLKPNGLP